MKNDREDESNWSEDTTTRERMLMGMFPDRESTEKAYHLLREKGYTEDEINLLMSDDTRKKHFTDRKGEETEIGTKAAEDAGKGAAVGGVVGAIAGVIAAIGTSILIPGLGIVIAGPLAAGLAGAGAGGVAGGIIGALVGSGIPEARAKIYESGIKNGMIVLGVHPHNEDDANYFEKDWNAHEGEHYPTNESESTHVNQIDDFHTNGSEIHSTNESEIHDTNERENHTTNEEDMH